ncbi:MAG TPA: hypothetical protein VJM31_13375 [Vicinamibacterales bacterium]|nr:hypothetical protein [Vicinamibacterales bacterium]
MSEPHNPDNVAVVHEESDVNVRAIFGFGIGLMAVAVVVHVFLWWLLGMYAQQAEREQTYAYPLAVAQRAQLPPAPRFQDNPQQDMRELRAKQQAILNGYGWINRESGIARIPIEDAMRMVIDHGLPTREATK